MYQRIKQYALLTRLDKPIGLLLLLWPTLWALWIAANGLPPLKILLVFIAGVFLMRSAGCAINDFADRHVDGSVERTKNRPLASKKIHAHEAILVFLSLAFIAFLLVVVFLNRLTLYIAFFGLLITFVYPFCKRFTYLPQFVLGLAFSISIPMSFAAITNHVSGVAWLLFLAAAIWPVAYDTLYAMSDRDDDLKIGIKSTAILAGQYDRIFVAIAQALFLILLMLVGYFLRFNFGYYVVLLISLLFFIYQQWLVKNREPKKCFQAFLNNNWVGLVIFLGIVLQ